MTPKLHELGLDFSKDDSPIDSEFKVLIFVTACDSGVFAAVDAAKTLFAGRRYGQDSAIPSDLVLPVYKAVLQAGDRDAFDFLYDRAISSSSTRQQREDCWEAFGYTKDEDNLCRAYDLTLEPDFSIANVHRLLDRSAATSLAYRVRWEWLRNNWDALSARMAVGLPMKGYVVSAAVKNLSTRKLLEDVKKHFDGRDKEGFESWYDQAIEHVESNIEWVERGKVDMRGFLERGGYMRDSYEVEG